MRWSHSNAAVKLVTPEARDGDEAARLAIEAAGEGTWEIQLKTGEHVLSARSRQLLGLEGDVANISIPLFLAALHPDDRERWKDALAEALDPEQTGDFHVELRTRGPQPGKEGPDERRLRASGRAFFQGLTAVRVAGTLLDITAEKLTTEDRDIRLDELGHDLRLPLNSISMGIHLVQRNHPAKDRILSAMQYTAQRMDRVIDQLLQTTRSATSDLPLQRERVSLAAICREAIEEASLAHPGHAIEFDPWDEASGEWDRDHLLHVVRNLLSNALRHGDADKPVLVSAVDCGERALLIVANRGRPISEAISAQLLASTRSGPWSADHLGLYIVKRIVSAHDGTIEISSEDNGTVFHIWLPKIPGKPQP